MSCASPTSWASAAGLLDLEGDLDDVLAERSAVDGTAISPLDRVRLARAALGVAGAEVLRRPRALGSEARVRGHGRRHSPRRDRAAVRHHYDVPEAFYRLVLGPTMVYSCAYFASAGDSLEDAQERKLDVICRKLRLRPGDRLLDVGCGWGSLLLHAARRYGVLATGVTLSAEQARVARERIRDAGLDARCEVRLADYRDVADGPYDAIASVGMYEHVGREQLGRYASALAALVRPGGLVLNHGIARLASGRGHDRTFIARFVFPDGDLHPLDDLLRAANGAGLEVRDVESLREHYPLTLRHWLANLAAHREQATRVAGAERERIWRAYMTGSAQAFDRGEISVFQTLLHQPGAPHPLPLARAS